MYGYAMYRPGSRRRLRQPPLVFLEASRHWQLSGAASRRQYMTALSHLLLKIHVQGPLHMYTSMHACWTMHEFLGCCSTMNICCIHCTGIHDLFLKKIKIAFITFLKNKKIIYLGWGLFLKSGGDNHQFNLFYMALSNFLRKHSF